MQTKMETLPFSIRSPRLLSLPIAPAPTLASSSTAFAKSSLYTALSHLLSLSSPSSVSQSPPPSLCFTTITPSSFFTFSYSLTFTSMLTNCFPYNFPGTEIRKVLSVIFPLFVFASFSTSLQNQHLFVDWSTT